MHNAWYVPHTVPSLSSCSHLSMQKLGVGRGREGGSSPMKYVFAFSHERDGIGVAMSLPDSDLMSEIKCTKSRIGAFRLLSLPH